MYLTTCICTCTLHYTICHLVHYMYSVRVLYMYTVYVHYTTLYTCIVQCTCTCTCIYMYMYTTCILQN